MEFLKKLAKLTLGIISLLWFIVMLLAWVTGNINKQITDPFLSILGYLLFLSIPAQWIGYIIHVYRNRRLTKKLKLIWALFLFCGHIVAFPIYWYFHIWRNAKEEPEQLSPSIVSSRTGTELIVHRNIVFRLAVLCLSLLPLLLGAFAVLQRMYGLGNNTYYVLGVLASISWIFLVVFYIVNVYRNKKLDQDVQTIWTILLIFGNIPVFLVYWYLYIWRKPENSS